MQVSLSGTAKGADTHLRDAENLVSLTTPTLT